MKLLIAFVYTAFLCIIRVLILKWMRDCRQYFVNVDDTVSQKVNLRINFRFVEDFSYSYYHFFLFVLYPLFTRLLYTKIVQEGHIFDVLDLAKRWFLILFYWW